MKSNISIGTAYSETAAFVRHEKRLLAPLVLALLVVPVSVSQLVQPLDPFVGPRGLQPWMIIGLIALVFQLAGQMAVSRLAMGWRGSLGSAISLAMRRLPSAIAAMMIFLLCLFLLLVPVVMILILTSGTGPSSTKLINSLTFLALLAAGPRIMLAPVIAMSERLGPWALVKRSWACSRGHFWRLLSFFILFLVTSIILSLAVSAVVGSIAALALGAPEPLSLSRLLMALAGGLVQGVAGTLYAAMVARILVQISPELTKGI